MPDLVAAANDQAHPPPEAGATKRGTSEGAQAVGGRVQRLVVRRGLRSQLHIACKLKVIADGRKLFKNPVTVAVHLLGSFPS